MRGCHVQFDPEDTAHADRALDADDAAHQFDQPFADNEPDARALSDMRLLPETIERLEQLPSLSGVNPSPVSVTEMRTRPDGDACSPRKRCRLPGCT